MDCKDVIRIRPFFTGCYDEKCNVINDGGGKYVGVGARYRFYKGSEKYPNYWVHDTDIIYDEYMQTMLSGENPTFKKVSEITLSEIDELKRRYK